MGCYYIKNRKVKIKEKLHKIWSYSIKKYIKFKFRKLLLAELKTTYFYIRTHIISYKKITILRVNINKII